MKERDNIVKLRRVPPATPPDAASILGALRSAILAVDGDNIIRQANAAAEALFATGSHYLLDMPVSSVLPPDSPVMTLMALARDRRLHVCEHGIIIDTPRTGRRVVSVNVSTIAECPGYVVLDLTEQSIAARMSAMVPTRNAARSAAAMSAMLAHEVKNPLSGIRGAAQLLDSNASEDEQVLTRLIIDETDRIVSLLDRMDVFAADHPILSETINIHTVLDHVRRIAENGFGRHARIRANYDPSLPPVAGNRNLLIQVFLNLVKNAAEAVPAEGGEIVISTSYQHGMRLSAPSTGESRNLPLMVTIQDNGAGVSDDLKPHLFDAFVTTKPSGSGLGLAMVAKIVDDHGGIIECDSQPRKTQFRVMLPISVQDEDV